MNQTITADDPTGTALLFLNRLTSPSLCERLLRKTADAMEKPVDSALLTRKADGVASAVDAGLGFWTAASRSLNARILSRYYALMHFSIAEQVAAPGTLSDLDTVQSSTNHGHGLTSKFDGGPALDGVHIGVVSSGFFRSYLEHLGAPLPNITLAKSLKNGLPAGAAEAAKLETLGTLLRRIPELSPILSDHFPSQDPLIIPIHYSDHNHKVQDDLRAERRRNGDRNRSVAVHSDYQYVELGDRLTSVSIDRAHSLAIPHLEGLEVVEATERREAHVRGRVRVGDGEYWHQKIPLYSSRSTRMNYIVPAFGGVSDCYAMHLALLYGLSIVVRYLPSLWRRLDRGDLDMDRALLEYYMTVLDSYGPVTAYSRITGSRLSVQNPGSLF